MVQAISDMQNVQGKPGTTQVNCFYLGKFLARTYTFFVANGVNSLYFSYLAWLKLPSLGKITLAG